LHKTIKKVSEDIELMKFNTAVSCLMEFVNAWNASDKNLDKKDAESFLKILSTFAPHLSEELWKQLKFKGLCCEQRWPKYDEKLIKQDKVLLIVQVNGKVRDKIEVNSDISQKDAEILVQSSEKIKNTIGENKIKKIVFVPNKLINIVV
jgi:leucyl-tRNA synthetase